MWKKLGLLLLDFLFGKALNALKSWIERKRAEKEIEKKNETVRIRQESANSPEEREEAARETLDNM